MTLTIVSHRDQLLVLQRRQEDSFAPDHGCGQAPRDGCFPQQVGVGSEVYRRTPLIRDTRGVRSAELGPVRGRGGCERDGAAEDSGAESCGDLGWIHGLRSYGFVVTGFGGLLRCGRFHFHLGARQSGWDPALRLIICVIEF